MSRVASRATRRHLLKKEIRPQFGMAPLTNHHIVAMPDKREYPWYASWDLAFHSVILAHTDPGILLLLARELQLAVTGLVPSELPRNRIAEAPSQLFRRGLTLELPTGSGKRPNLDRVATELRCRLLGPFLLDANDRRPAHGPNPRFQNDPDWRDPLLFYEYFLYEYFHAETGESLGALHQTGWTALPRRSWRTERVGAGPKLSRSKLARIFGFSLSPIALGQVTLELF
jgi:hypothetical protein